MPFILFSWCLEVTEELRKIRRIQEKIMAVVQLDDSVLSSTASAIETLVATDNALVSAVTAFLANPVVQQLPDADLTTINQAVSDAGVANTAAVNAQAALVAATPAPPAPVDTPPATS